MRVNLAAQILSEMFANALEFTYGDQMANLHETNWKRNTDDPLLDLLLNVFLPYFDERTSHINALFQHLPAADKAWKQLSQQTLIGLFIKTKCVVEYVQFHLAKGVAIVINYHQKGGANENPTVFEVYHIIIRSELSAY